MKAIILSAGKGTRVRPITYSMPKPMIPIINKPVMEILVELLKSHGIKEIMVNTSYLSHSIESYFRDGARFGVQMAYSFEGRIENDQILDEPIGSAGALKKIQEHSGFFDETFAVLVGDAVIDLDLSRLLDIHKEKKALATIALAGLERSEVSSFGVVVTDDEGRILEFQEKPKVEDAKSTTVNTGIYIFEPEIIDRIPSGEVYDIGGQLFPKLVEEKAPLYGSNIPFQWLDIGKVHDYYQVIQTALEGKINGFKIPGEEIANGIFAGLNLNIDLSKCDITPPVYIGGSATLEPGCRVIGPSMIGAGTVIETGALVEKSVVFDYTKISSSAEVKEMMICGNYCISSDGTVIDLKKYDIDWAITDSRATEKILSNEQRDLLQMLQEIQSSVI
jgi:mannose-1-phosphate guanylyltransferase